MKKNIIILCCIIALAAFAAGYLVSARDGRGLHGARKILYYVDPMHPSYRSDKPGIAPDCGMALEPVYADGPGPATAAPGLPAGGVRVTAAQQQLIGVTTAPVVKGEVAQTLRVLGRVAPDENRVYRINSSLQGYVQHVSAVTTGTFVASDEYLGAIYSPELYSLINAYIFALNSIDRQNKMTPEDIPRLQNNPSVRAARNGLINLGMSDTQLRELLLTRVNREVVEIRASRAGYVVQRNISVGERFERGTVFYQIADLSRVWVLADIFEKESAYFAPGTRCTVRLPHRNSSFNGRVSAVLPLYDPATRTLKVRIEVDNTGLILRPEMFAQVELAVTAPPAILIPRDALIDSGLKRTVYLDRGNGVFEPRLVETGRHYGDRVEILSGLHEGDRIVVSGAFLLDSESRLKSSAAGINGTPGRDPVCGMALDEERAKGAGLTRQYAGKTWYFCSPGDMAKFDKAPQRYAGGQTAPEPMGGKHTLPAAGGGSAHSGTLPGPGRAAPPAKPASDTTAGQPWYKKLPPGRVLLDRTGYPSIGIDPQGGVIPIDHGAVPQAGTTEGEAVPEEGSTLMDMIRSSTPKPAPGKGAPATGTGPAATPK